MRRSFAVPTLVVLVLALGFGAAACGGDDDESASATTAAAATTEEGGAASDVEFTGSVEEDVPIGYDEPEKGNFRLAYLNPLGGNEFLNTLGRAMKLETERLGGSYVELDAKGDVDTQVSEFEQVVAQDVDGIFVFALDPGAVQPALARAKQAKIPVVTIDLNFESAEDIGDFDSQIWQRRDEAAFLGAQEMARQIGGEADIATIDFAVQVPSIVYSIERGTYWAEKFGLTVVGKASNQSDDIAGGEQAMTELLGNYPDIKGVIGYNDPSAIGAAAAARSQGKEGLVFGGQNGGSDALEAIKAGRLSYTAKLDPPSMGKFAAWGLYNLLQGKTIPKTIKAEAPEIVNSDNIDSVKSWDDQLQEEYGKTE
ncbi:MAG TPA: sugar ABC transporter substrate-binding protein [Gaiellaceae bacterium]|nr:sugar ABC transporter substrate-binding protein [Gaiellaceae bacterium]